MNILGGIIAVLIVLALAAVVLLALLLAIVRLYTKVGESMSQVPRRSQRPLR